MSDCEILEHLPEDGIPDGLNIQDVDSEEWPSEFTAQAFQAWLYEGRHNCDVAQALLHAWTHNNLRTSDNETIYDFFHGLLRELHPESKNHCLPLTALARFVLENCGLSFQLHAKTGDDQIIEVAERIAEEAAMVNAYLNVWKSTGTTETAPQKHVQADLEQKVAEVFTWPQIQKTPTPERSDGRFAKAFPLTFPTGSGDLYMTRHRSDFSVAEWAQHVLRYYDGRALSSLRGHRVVWAIFNTVLREESFKHGSLVHRRTNQSAMTKAELQELCARQDDLVSKLSSFGAEIPTTSMHWKRTGNHLEWIVRQMSWKAPWTNTGQQEILKEKRRKIPPLPRNKQASDECPSRQEQPNSATQEPPAALPTDLDAAVVTQPLAERKNEDKHTDDSDASSTESDNPGGESNDSDSGDNDTDDSDEDENRDENQPPLDPPAATDEPSNLPHPRKLWRTMPRVHTEDRYGYGRIPAFWFTLNFPYNYCFELHRFHDAVDLAKQIKTSNVPETTNESNAPLPDIDTRCRWVLDNPDIVAFVHALRVEINVRYVMAHVVHCTEDQPFLYWLRYEWGSNGNPHAHGQAYVADNPNFECIIPDAETKQRLIELGYPKAADYKLKEEAEAKLGDFFHKYISEWHPSKDSAGNNLYNYEKEFLFDKKLPEATMHRFAGASRDSHGRTRTRSGPFAKSPSGAHRRRTATRHARPRPAHLGSPCLCSKRFQVPGHRVRILPLPLPETPPAFKLGEARYGGR